MNLDDAQKTAVRQWIEEGQKLSEIQNRIESQFGLRITYMEARFLLDDLKVAPKDGAPAHEEVPAETDKATGSAQPEEEDVSGSMAGEDPGLPGGGSASVTVDQLARPGAMISGKVTFSDGKAAEWYLDQMGRLGVSAAEEGYKPSQADLVAFQSDLQRQLAKMGYG